MPSKSRDAAQFQLLADLGRQRGDGLLDGLVACAGRFECVDVSGFGRDGGSHDLVGQRLELRVLGDEVRLAVQLDEHAVPGRDQTFGRGALGALADILGALDPQRLDGLVEVAVGFHQRVLAVEHSGTGQLPQSLDVGSGVVRHISLPWGLIRSRQRRPGRRGGRAMRVAEASSSCSHSASGSAASASGLPSPRPRPARACRPSATADAITLVSSAAERIASSLPGIG